MTDTSKIINSLGLNKIERGRRDLSELSNMDLSSSVRYPDVDKLTGSTVGGVEKNPVEGSNRISHANVDVMSDGLLRLPSGRMVKYQRRLISELDKVVIFEGNPRYNQPQDTSDLEVQFVTTGGNIIPAIGRDVRDELLQVIAGSRRTEAVKRTNTSLLIDVILDTITDDEASDIAWMENQGRKDPDAYEQATYYAQRYALAKRKQSVTSIEQFAKKYSMTETNMRRYLRVAEVPGWLINLCPRNKTDDQGKIYEVWTLRKAVALADIFKEQAGEITPELKLQMEKFRFKDPDGIISRLSKLIGGPGKVTSKNILLGEKGPIGSTEVGRRKNTLKISINEHAPASMREEILSIIEKYTKG